MAEHFSSNARFDSNNFFYTGFSYGGRSVLMLMGDLSFADGKTWAGLVAAEPDCNSFYQPKNFGVSLLTIKGGERHYEPLPCQTMTDLYQEFGTDAELVVLPKSNHYFSHSGEIVKGLAFNGCGKNPLIILSKGVMYFWMGLGPRERSFARNASLKRVEKENLVRI